MRTVSIYDEDEPCQGTARRKKYAESMRSHVESEKRDAESLLGGDESRCYAAAT